MLTKLYVKQENDTQLFMFYLIQLAIMIQSGPTLQFEWLAKDWIPPDAIYFEQWFHYQYHEWNRISWVNKAYMSIHVKQQTSRLFYQHAKVKIGCH